MLEKGPRPRTVTASGAAPPSPRSEAFTTHVTLGEKASVYPERLCSFVKSVTAVGVTSMLCDGQYGPGSHFMIVSLLYILFTESQTFQFIADIFPGFLGINCRHIYVCINHMHLSFNTF